MKNIEIILKDEDARFLNEHLKEVSFKEGKNFFAIEQCREIFQSLISLLVEIGLDKDDEPTRLGLYIEGLTDIFNKPLLEDEENGD